jgi:nitric oxide reductase subunit B
MSIRVLKWAAILSFIVAMVILVGGRFSMNDELPPYPGKVVDADGKVLFTKSDIMAGQGVYQRYGLMDHGAVWGHGSQRGPEFSASTLHFMAEAAQDYFATKDHGKPYKQLQGLEKEIVDVKVKMEIKANRYDPQKDVLLLTAAQVKGLEQVVQHWEKTFKDGERRYGFLANTVPSKEERLQISRFFFWTAWVASTLRPGKD